MANRQRYVAFSASSGFSMHDVCAFLRFEHVSLVRFEQRFQRVRVCHDLFHINQQLVANTESCGVANADLFSSGIQRRQRKRVLKHNDPGFYGLVGVGGQLLGVVGELPAVGFALEVLFPTQDIFVNENGVLIFVAGIGVRLDFGLFFIRC